MKRSREVEMAEMASKCLMLLSRVGETERSSSSRVFSCKTCSREFDSFQALGGHRTSHKKARLADDEPVKNIKAHECSVCGVEFAIGQALGGHMRRHRNDAVARDRNKTTTRDVCLDLNLGPRHDMDLSLRLGLVL